MWDTCSAIYDQGHVRQPNYSEFMTHRRRTEFYVLRFLLIACRNIMMLDGKFLWE